MYLISTGAETGKAEKQDADAEWDVSRTSIIPENSMLPELSK